MRLTIHAVCSLAVHKKHNTVVLKKQGEKAEQGFQPGTFSNTGRNLHSQ
jgi:hypothetical protein